jgi:hypothetical protein
MRVSMLIKKFTGFMESEGLLLWSQKPIMTPYPELVESSSDPYTLLSKNHLDFIFSSKHIFSK